MTRTVGKLVIEGTNPDEPVFFPLVGPEILIGRLQSVDLVLEDPSVSRIHAKIVKEGGRNVIVDLESSSGTIVNGEPIARHALSEGDVIEIAATRMEYRE